MSDEQTSSEGGEGLSGSEWGTLMHAAYANGGDLKAAVERILADRLAAAQAERDRAIEARDQQWAERYSVLRIDLTTCESIANRIEDRAESAEAALDTARRKADDLRARLGTVEALAAKWDEAAGTDRDNESRALREVAAYLRAALATPPAVQRDAEVGARALREAADAIAAWDTRSGDIEQARVEVFLHDRADALAPDADGREST